MDAQLKTLLIGIGNRFRGDDAAGLAIIGRLRSDPIPGAVICESSGEIGELIEMWGTADLVFAIDAVSSGATPGTIHRFEAHRQALPTSAFQTSTHAFSLAEAIELARILGRLPPWLIVYGIEGRNFGYGCNLSEPVSDVLDSVPPRILADIELFNGKTSDHVGVEA